jgi:hypothetical protein
MEGRTMQAAASEKLLTAAETATRLRVHKDTLRRWRAIGCGPTFVKIGAAYRYPADHLETWIQRRATAPEDPPGLFRQSDRNAAEAMRWNA